MDSHDIENRLLEALLERKEQRLREYAVSVLISHLLRETYGINNEKTFSLREISASLSEESAGLVLQIERTEDGEDHTITVSVCDEAGVEKARAKGATEH